MMEQPLTWGRVLKQQANTLEEKELLEWMDCLENCVWQTLWEDVGPALFLLTKKTWEEEEGRTPKSWATGLIGMIPKDPSNERWRFETNHIVGK